MCFYNICFMLNFFLYCSLSLTLIIDYGKVREADSYDYYECISWNLLSAEIICFTKSVLLQIQMCNLYDPFAGSFMRETRVKMSFNFKNSDVLASAFLGTCEVKLTSLIRMWKYGISTHCLQTICLITEFLPFMQ